MPGCKSQKEVLRKVGDIVEKLRAKYGANEVKKYYSKFDVAVEVPLA